MLKLKAIKKDNWTHISKWRILIKLVLFGNMSTYSVAATIFHVTYGTWKILSIRIMASFILHQRIVSFHIIFLFLYIFLLTSLPHYFLHSTWCHPFPLWNLQNWDGGSLYPWKIWGQDSHETNWIWVMSSLVFIILLFCSCSVPLKYFL